MSLENKFIRNIAIGAASLSIAFGADRLISGQNTVNPDSTRPNMLVQNLEINNSQELLQTIDASLNELQAIHQLKPAGGMSTKVDIIVSYTVDGKVRETRNINLDIKTDDITGKIFDAKNILTFAKIKTRENPNSPAELNVWLRRSDDFEIKIQTANSTELYNVRITSTMYPQKASIDFEVTPNSNNKITCANPQFPNGFEFTYDPSGKPNFSTGERGRGEPSKAQLEFAKQYLVSHLPESEASRFEQAILTILNG